MLYYNRFYLSYLSDDSIIKYAHVCTHTNTLTNDCISVQVSKSEERSQNIVLYLITWIVFIIQFCRSVT